MRKLLRALPVAAAIFLTLALAASSKVGLSGHHHQHVSLRPFAIVYGGLLVAEVLMLLVTRTRKAQPQQRQPASSYRYGPQGRPW